MQSQMSVKISPIMPQGRQVNMGQMNEEEFEKILQVLQKDFELRQKEQDRLSKIQEDIEEENQKATVLSKKTKLNENVCIRCCRSFGIIFNRKQTCQLCNLYICKSCCLYDRENKGYICHTCAEARELKMKSCEWFYDNVSKKFKRFGSAKVVRTLYKQKRKDSARRYHTDNESDSGYDPSLLSSKQYGSLQSLDRLHQQVEGHDRDTEVDLTKDGFDPVIPAPIQFGPSVKPPLNKDINSNHNDRGSHEEKESSTKGVSDIYKEAFENAKTTEERKFHGRFDMFKSELQKSLENLLSSGVNHSYSNNSYSDVLVNYRGKLKDLIVSLSQRLEIVIESFDSTSDDPLETSQKVRQLVSRLVTESVGEQLDLGSDEAVSDLSSLSEESSDPIKSFEDQLAHAVVTKVLENHRRDHHLDFCLDELDGRKDEVDQARNSSMSEEKSDNERQFDSESMPSDNEKCDTVHSNSTAKSHVTNNGKGHVTNNVNQKITLQDSSMQCEPYENQKESSFRERPKSVNVMVQSELYENQKDTILLERPKSVNEMVQCELYESQKDRRKPERPNSVNEIVQCDIRSDVDSLGHSDLENDLCESEQIEKCESVKSFSSSSTNVENEFEKLRSFAMDLSSRSQPQVRQVEEYLDELPMEVEKVDRTEGQQEFSSRYDTYDRVHDDTRISLPSLEDYDYDYGTSEVDPDLLSMNLAPIIEEDEEGAEDEDDDLDDEEKENKGQGQNWKGNWIFKSPAGITPYKNVGQTKKVEGLSQVYMTIPQPKEYMSPKIGQRDVDQMSDLSDAESNLSDEESSFYANTSAEISRISKKHGKNRMRSSSVQTDESDVDDVRERSSSMSKSHIESSADESVSSKKKKLLEEYVPADGEDPKFEIPPESLEVPEGEPAKFSLRFAGTEPINVFWYKVEDDLVELMDSEQYTTSRDGNHCYLTIYNPVKADGGQYMAIAINEKGQCCQYMILSIKKNKQELKKPEFLKEIQDVDATEGQTVKFRCKVKGYPQPRICWYKDGKLLANDDCYKIEKFGNRDYILTIDFASMNDDAEYTVVAKNIAGETKSVAQLIVDTDEVKPSQPDSLPTSSQRKDDQQLTNLNRKLYETKTDVTDAAEDLLNTANEKTAAENVRKTSRAIDLVESTDNLIDNNKMDCLATSTPRSSEESIHTPRSKKDIPENKPKWLQFVKEDGDIPTHSLLLSKQSNKTNDSYFNQPIKTTETGHVPLSVDTSDHVTTKSDDFISDTSFIPETVHHSNVDQIHLTVSKDNTDHVTNTQPLDTSLDSSNISSDLNDNVLDSEPQTVNFGAKPVQAEFYSRDYIINNKNTPSKPPRKKWEVKTDHYSPGAEIVNKQKDLDNVEEKIYMSASKLSNLESKLNHLQQEVNSTHSDDKRKMSYLEDDIAQTVAETCRSDHDVGAIERSVEALQVSCPASPRSADDDNSNMSSPSLSIDSGFSSIRERPQPTVIIGTTGEDDLPESRTELNEETGVELPSVNRLKQLFAHSQEEEAAFKRRSSLDGPVHSITARTLGKDKVEKIRSMARTVNHPSPLAAESSNQSKAGKSQITVTLAPVSQTISYQPKASQIFPKEKGAYFPPDQPIKRDNASKIESQPISKANTSSKSVRAPPPPCQSNPSQTFSKNETSDETSSEKKKNSRIRAGCINARAKFWEKKIQGDSTGTEEEYPSMLEQVPD
ncbi:uro-adherence factor A-like isoform X6 [Mytilus edulis]|uniref:uro-adherence factor A-like isoform X6 n=1 Tax=Mytilus edulis TaxID=6550 RepID=UPI0039EEF74F